ncbi:hypothetical protein SCAR479_11754 [Seiridium cardinale]|uniref:Uncharacterized protein n=1 Tax=Seiridium cardinale TaxID=138064 RepID=A0ABR2XCX8_9PEZI
MNIILLFSNATSKGERSDCRTNEPAFSPSATTLATALVCPLWLRIWTWLFAARPDMTAFLLDNRFILDLFSGTTSLTDSWSAASDDMRSGSTCPSSLLASKSRWRMETGWPPPKDPSVQLSRMADKSSVGTRKQGFIMTGNQLISLAQPPLPQTLEFFPSAIGSQ